MTHRVRWAAGVLVTAAGLAVVVWPRGPYPCRATFERVRIGMAVSDVHAAVGSPPGDYSSGEVMSISSYARSSPRRESEPESWLADDGCLEVFFDEGGGVKDVRITPVMPMRVGLIARVRGWLGL